jgi:hypothetical protein
LHLVLTVSRAVSAAERTKFSDQGHGGLGHCNGWFGGLPFSQELERETLNACVPHSPTDICALSTLQHDPMRPRGLVDLDFAFLDQQIQKAPKEVAFMLALSVRVFQS